MTHERAIDDGDSTTRRGCGTALVTPFNADGVVDEAALRALVDWQIDEGIHFLVPCGTTGEAATMTLDEHRRVVEITVEQAKGRVPIVAGAGEQRHAEGDRALEDDARRSARRICCTRRRCTTSRRSAASSRTIARSPTRSICRSSSTTCPGRTGSNIEAKTTLEMAKIPGIAAVKEASGNLAQIADIIRRPRRRRSPCSPATTSSRCPSWRSAATASSRSSRTRRRKLMSRAVRLDARPATSPPRARFTSSCCRGCARAFVESNPMPVKAALAMMGKIENVLRLPLVPMARREQRRRFVRRCATAGALDVTRRRSLQRRIEDARGDAAGRAAAARRRRRSIDDLLDALERGEVRAAERDGDGNVAARCRG